MPRIPYGFAAWILLAAAVGAISGCVPVREGPEPQFPSPMAESVRSHDRVTPGPRPGRSFTVTGVLPADVPVFVTGGPAEEPDLLVHFHGSAYLVEDAVSRLDRPAAGATVHLGSGSSAYETPFAEPGMFAALLDSIRAVVPFGRVYLSSWSAGYGAVRAILRVDADRIHGILLLDGLHTDYVPRGTRLAEGGSLNAERMEPFLAYAARAAAGSVRMVVTHSDIFPGTYASTTETATWLADALDVSQTAVLEWGPGGMQQVSEARAGRLAILGYAGNTAPDHVDHLHALAPLLQMLAAP